MTERTRLDTARSIARWLLAAIYLVAGYLHVTKPAVFEAIVPSWVPAPHLVVILTGWCEIAGAIGLLLPRTRRWAGILLALYALCVWPANVQHMLLDGGRHLGYHIPRLAAQPAIIWWALFAGGIVTWPFRRRVLQGVSRAQ